MQIPINAVSHIQAADRALDELHELMNISGRPADEPVAFVGAAINNLMPCLVVLANSLDISKNRRIHYNDEENLISSIHAIHRFFFTDLINSVEAALDSIIKDKKYALNISKREKLESLLEVNQCHIDDSTKKSLLRLIGGQASFNDRLNPVLENANLSKKQQKMWREFFDACRIVRHKCAHFDATLSKHDMDVLNKANWSGLVVNGELKFSVSFYPAIYRHVINFWG